MYNLPVPANQVMVPWSNLSMQYAPFVPQSIRTDPALMNLVPAISAYCCFQIQRAVQEQPQNPLRIFMYNMCAPNSWQNPESEACIAMAVDFLWAAVINGMYPTPEQGLNDACDKVIAMVRSAYLLKYQQLEQFCDPQLAYNAKLLLPKFQEAVALITNTKARLTQVAVGQQPVYGQAMVPTGYGVQQQQRPYQGGGGFNWQAQLNTQSTAMPTGGAVFTGGQAVPVSSGQGGKFGSGGRYDQTVVRQPVLVPQEPTQEVHVKVETQAAAAATPAVDEQLIPLEQVKWSPSENYPHPPAYNPEAYAMFVRIAADGSMEPVIKKKEELPVDFTRHQVGTFGARPKNLDLKGRADQLERIQSGVQQINDQDTPKPAEGAEPVVLPFNSLIRPDPLSEVSNEAAWMVAELERLTKRVDERIPDIYRVHGQIYQAIVGTQNETAYVRGFGACDTFIELREKLNASVNRVSGALWSAVNHRMTRALNRTIKENLSIPGLRIDSFVEDIEDLIKLVESRYGEVVLGALTKHQAALIRRTLGSFGDEEATEEAAAYMQGDEFQGEGAPKVTFIVSNVSFTLLNCWSYELNLQLQPKTSSVVIETFTPMVYQLVKGLFEAQSTLEFESAHGEFDTHLIKTLDGRVLEAQRGFLNDEYFVLTLVE